LVDVRRFDTLAGAEQVDWFFREVTGSLDREQPQDATVTWDPHPEIESREMEKVLASAEYQAGARVLARMGLSLDTGLCFPQLPELAAFAKAVPGLTIVLNHLGGLTRIGPYANRDEEVLAAWRRGIAGLADCPNVNLKLGGIGMPRMGFDWHAREKPIGSEELAASMASLMSYCIEQLGPNGVCSKATSRSTRCRSRITCCSTPLSGSPRGIRPPSAPTCSTTRPHAPVGLPMPERVCREPIAVVCCRLALIEWSGYYGPFDQDGNG
jgi:hypothetical protein